MAGNSGYFMKGLSSGLQSGLNMGKQIQEMQWQKAQRKKLETKQAEYEEGMVTIGGLMKQLSADGTWSEDDEMKITTCFYAMIPEVQAVYQDAVNAIQTMNKSKFEEDMNWLSLTREETEGMDWTNAQGIFDITEGRITTEKGKNYFEAYRNMAEKKASIVAAPKSVSPYDFYGQSPADVQGQIAGSVAGQTPGLEGVEFTQPQAEQPTEMDVMGETTKKLDAAYATGNANYFNQMAKSLNVPTTFDTYKQKYEKPGGTTTKTPKVQDPNDILFGTNGIMKNYINSGSQLGEEQKAEIRNNYNLIKPSLSADVRTKVEDYLQQIGIDVNAVIEAPTTEPTTLEAKQPGLIGKAWNYLKNTTIGDVKNKIQDKGNTPQQQEYTAMNDDELADLALTGDQAAIDELKRRGLL